MIDEVISCQLTVGEGKEKRPVFPVTKPQFVEGLDDALSEKSEDLLRKAKESGEFQGEPGAAGQDGADGKDGLDGYTPVRGVDYWTDADKEEIKSDVEESVLENLDNYPTLLERLSWRPEATLRTVTEIRFVEDYNPESYDETWDAGVEAGTITGYREGDIITISANGKRKIKMNSNSAAMFAYGYKLKAIHGLEMLDASEVATMGGMYNFCYVLTTVDMSCWKCDKLTNTGGMFQYCYKLRKVKMPQGMHSVTVTASVFEDCHKLVEVDMGDGPSVVGNKMFAKCINLERITGLSNVTTVGARAFIYTAKLKDVDLNPAVLTSIGESAFRLSSIEDCIRMDDLNTACTIGSMATRAKRWADYSVFGAIQDKVIPTVLLRVPHADSQAKYGSIIFGKLDVPWDSTTKAVDVSIADGGCSFFTLYHEWQCINRGTDNEKAGFNAFWNDFFSDFYTTTTDQYDQALAILGWTKTTTSVVGADPLDTIIARLNNGLPTYVSMQSANIDGYHAVLIVGGDTLSGKLAVLDSKISNDNAELVWVKFEDIFTSESTDYDSIKAHTYG